MAKHEPWHPADYDLADAYAMQRLQAGDATEEQQKRALDWIINKACETYEPTFYPGGLEGQRNSDLAQGKRFAGMQIVKMLNIDTAKLRRSEDG